MSPETAVCDQLLRKAGKHLFEGLAAAGEQTVRVPSLRHAFARLSAFGQRITLDNGHALVVVGQGACRHQTAHARTNDHRVPT
jgi:hypothetical protein